MNPGQTHAAEDLRFTLAMAAARTARRNRPAYLAWCGVLLLVVAGLYLLMSYQALGAAHDRLESAKRTADEASKITGKLASLIAAEQGAEGLRAFDPAPNLRTEIDRIARDAGFKGEPPVPRVVPDQVPGVRGILRKFSYEVRGQQLPVLMTWMDRCTKQINGLEVYSITLTPEPTAWNLKVTFSRWEREQ
ncbi:MAG: hypothetical protein HUU18_05820 [Phycisphaerales bacterium]|nr:hypothetical protein [Phycisphaerales bacterium]